jgi:N-sulfoglucosamine sulfohydrolase
MRRRDLLKAAATTPFVAAAACTTMREPGPGLPRNLLLIVSDDQSRFDLGCYGNPACTTPNVDGLAAEGMRFDRAYSPVGLCTPARSSLYTGLYPHKNGATGFGPILPEVPTWPELLAGACVTAMMGKYNVQPRERFPFDFFDGLGVKTGPGVDPASYERGFASLLQAAGTRRFAAIVNLKDPHRPFDEDLYVPEVDGKPVAAHDPDDAWVPPCLWDTPATRKELSDYYDALRRLDRSVGHVLGLLAESGRAEDTLVIFTSDNGMPFPFGKSTLYEAGINVPFLVRWPGVVAAGSVHPALANLVDLLPTALEAFDVPSSDSFDGHSLLPLLRGEVSAVRSRSIGVHDDMLKEPNRVKRQRNFPTRAPTPRSRSIRGERFKYIRNFDTQLEFTNNVLEHSWTWSSWGHVAANDPALRARMDGLRFRAEEELFDLEADPWELENLASVPEHRATMRQLASELREWMRREADPLLADWPA